jgi:hypothetical protein
MPQQNVYSGLGLAQRILIDDQHHASLRPVRGCDFLRDFWVWMSGEFVRFRALSMMDGSLLPAVRPIEEGN